MNPTDIVGEGRRRTEEEGETQRCNWRRQKKNRKRRTLEIQPGKAEERKKVNLRDIVGEGRRTEEEGEPQRYSWGRQKNRRRR